MDPWPPLDGAVPPGLPRLRGDGPLAALRWSCAARAAPPTRGWTFMNEAAEKATKGCPAYAGMDPYKRSGWPWGSGLPRLRGDGPPWIGCQKVSKGAAPPTRGWTQVVLYGLVSGRRLPRLRGDGPYLQYLRLWPTVAAPPTRGWTRLSKMPTSCFAGCPAYAGMDPASWPRPCTASGCPAYAGMDPYRR